MRPKVRYIVLLLALVATFACERAASERLPTIAIVTLMSHPSLDTLQVELLAQLARDGYVQDSSVRVIVRNAGGQQSAVGGMVSEAAATQPDVLVAITTPVAQAARRAFQGKLVFGAVTDPLSAGLVPAADSTFDGVSGTSDAFPFRDQLALIRELTPQVKRLAVILNPGEAAAQYGLREIRKAAPQFGFDIIEAPVTSSTDIYAAAANLVGRADAFLITSDNTTISGLPAILRVAVPRGIPVYAGEAGSVERGALATVSAGYPYLGRETGRLVGRMLRGETRLPVVVGGAADVVLNRKMSALLKIDVPESVLQRVTVFVDTIRD